MYVLFAKFLVDEDSPFVAGKVSQEPVDTEVNSACVSQSLTIQKSDTQPTAQRADNDCGVMVTGVKEKKTIPCERTTDDIRGPMLPNKQSRVEEHAALEVPPFKALKEKSVISDPDSDDGKMTSGADHSPEFICPQTVSSTAEAEDSGDQPGVGSEVCTAGSAHQMKAGSHSLSQACFMCTMETRDVLGCNRSLQPVKSKADEKYPNEAPARKTQTRPQKLPSNPFPSQSPPETKSQQPQEKSSCPPHPPVAPAPPRPGGKEDYWEKIVSQGPDSLWDLRLRSLHRSFSV
jgi:hypothetical protein